MPRMYLSARGEVVNFDATMIKQQLAAAPMTIDVEKRKTFVDSKEVRKKSEAPVAAASEFELEAVEAIDDKKPAKKK